MNDAEFARRYGPWAVLAGGSEGLGVAFAHRLAKLGLNLLVVARKPEPLAELAADIRKQHGTDVRTLSQDLTTPDAVANIIAATKGLEVGLMVYNAGADTRVKPFIERPLDEAVRLTTLNITTPMSLAHHFAPAMVERKKGGFIFMSSFASCVGTPGNMVYGASKAFSNVFSEGLWYELGKHNVDVLGAIVGIIQTPAMERMGLSFDGIISVTKPDVLADEILAAIDKGPTIHAGGIHDSAWRYRTLPRDEAVRALAAFSDFIVGNAGASRSKGASL